MATTTKLQQTWSQTHQPAANTIATTTRAAQSGVQHVCRAITASFSATGVAPTAIQVEVVLRDGASGAGTVLWSCGMSLPATAGASTVVALTDLEIAGTTGTAMTLEFSAAGGANTVERVSLVGYDQ